MLTRAPSLPRLLVLCLVGASLGFAACVDASVDANANGAPDAGNDDDDTSDAEGEPAGEGERLPAEGEGEAGTLPEPDAGPGPFDPGCTVVAPSSCPSPAPQYADVAPIVALRCQGCHSTGGPEWPLETHKQLADWGPDVRDLVATCAMPPPPGHAEMPDAEKVTLLTWVLCGAPE